MGYIDGDNEMKHIFGASVVNDFMDTPYGFVLAANKGLTASIIQRFREYFGLSLAKISSFLSVSEPTIYRWIQDDRSLDKNTSIKLMELTQLFQYAIQVFRSKKAFFSWLGQSNITLGGIAPIELLEVPEGIGKVRDLVGRIEYGVYS